MQAIRFKQLMKNSHDSALAQELEQAVDAILQQLRLHVGLQCIEATETRNKTMLGLHQSCRLCHHGNAIRSIHLSLLT